MNSPLQLKNHHFDALCIRAVEGGQANASFQVQPSIKVDADDAKMNWRVSVTVKLTSQADTPFQYEGDVTATGFFQIHETVPEDKRERIVMVNGGSILYGSIREAVLNFTARSAYGAFSLPTLSFQRIFELGAKESAQDSASKEESAVSEPAK